MEYCQMADSKIDICERGNFDEILIIISPFIVQALPSYKQNNQFIN